MMNDKVSDTGEPDAEKRILLTTGKMPGY